MATRFGEIDPTRLVESHLALLRGGLAYRAHNALAAEQDFGRGHIDGRRDTAGHSSRRREERRVGWRCGRSASTAIEMKAHLRQLADTFCRSVVAQDAAIARGDARTGNAHARKYFAAFDDLIAEADGGMDAALTLLTDERPNVRVMAASLLLLSIRSPPVRSALEVLEAEAKGAGLVAFGAKQSLARWQEKVRAKARRAKARQKK
jgi:hypothetical protein